MQGFREAEAVDVCGLVDLGYTGTDWTFERRVTGGSYTRARLDRALASPEWIEDYPTAVVRHMHAVKSDHTPLFLVMECDRVQACSVGIGYQSGSDMRRCGRSMMVLLIL